MESSPGRKDALLFRDFIVNARKAAADGLARASAPDETVGGRTLRLAGRMSWSQSARNVPGEDGRFGEFGGRFVPESLMPACLELEKWLRRRLGRPLVPR